MAMMSKRGLNRTRSLSLTDMSINDNSNIQCNIKEMLKPLCRARCVKNKGAILIVTWCYLVFGTFYYLKYIGPSQYDATALYTVQAVGGTMLPVLGWLSDIRFGRYKVISCSLFMMWICSLLYTAVLVAAEMVHFKYAYTVGIVLVIGVGIGFGGFQANIIQFGTDQLVDASVPEIKSLVAWCSWTIISSELVVHFILTCVQNRLAAPLFVCCNLTVAIIFRITLKQMLIKEPTTQNPFSLVYRVVKYAVKHKYARQRSAFTYCEDALPSRIDFGKSKYGGPFTTEQVEDVKMFFQIISLLFIGCALVIFIEDWSSIKSKLNSFFRNEDITQPFTECATDYFITGLYFISGTIFIPLQELLIYPLFHRCLPTVTSTFKFSVGAMVGLAKQTVALILVLIARNNYYTDMLNNHTNTTLHCVLQEPKGVLGTYVDYRWTAALNIMKAFSDLMMIIGVLEFFCAQVPYSMKGLVAGAAYGLLVVYSSILSGIDQLFSNSSFKWGTGVISCGFWYFVSVLTFLIITIIILLLAFKFYKRRKREDVLPNEQIFAERYYST